MKTIKCVLSVLLCCILLAAFASMAYADSSLILQASATYTIPDAGEAFHFSAITVPDGAHYTAKILSAYYYKDGKYAFITDGDSVIAGVCYSVRIRFYADNGYRLDDGKTEYFINDEPAKTIVGTNMPEVVFYAENKAPDEPAPSRPSFFERVLNFFISIRLRIAHFFQWLRHLFGLV